MNKIARYFPDTNLINGHDGLTRIASKVGVRVDTLGKGEFLCFVNKRKTSVKLLANEGVICYLRLKKGHINPMAIKHLPRYFNGSTINYTEAIQAVMKQQFPKWFEPK